MWKIIVLSMIVGLANAEKTTYKNYKLFSIIPLSELHVQILNISEKLVEGLTFWKAPTTVGRKLDLMVAPNILPFFYDFMEQINLLYELIIEDIAELIEKEFEIEFRHGRSITFDLGRYHTLEEIYENLDDLANRYPDKVQTIVGGQTFQGREIKGVKVLFDANNPRIFIEGGIHSNEWISPATVMYILHQLLTSNDADVRDLAENHNWYIFPLFNPDGYVYSHTEKRLWRKTRKPYYHNVLCFGADLNRNWNFKWNDLINHSCLPDYPGDKPFSEIEAKSMSEYIESISNKFYAYISFQSYGQYLLFPYGFTKGHSVVYDELYGIAKKAVTALKQRYGTEYEIGNVAEMIYLTSGLPVDYIQGIYGKRFVYMYQLRDRGRNGFLLPPDQIIPTGEETLDSLVAMFDEVWEHS